MHSFFQSSQVRTLLPLVIGSVWVFHGLYSKLLGGIPRHRAIVGRILGSHLAGIATPVIGGLEVLLGIWVFTGWRPVACAAVQTAALVTMNALEIALATDLLISALGMVLLNLGFLCLIWHWATTSRPVG
jgi:hypothetical protein